MPQRPFVLPSGIDFYAGDGTAAGAADPLLVVSDSTNKVGINSQIPSGTLDINIANASDKGLIVRSFTSGTGNIFEAQSAASGTLVVIDASGEVGINNAAPAAMLDITSRSSSTMGTIIKAAASQAVDILEIQNSSSTPLFTVNSAGRVGIGSGSQTPTGTLDVTSLSTSTQTAILRAVSGQTSNIFETKRFSNGITGLFTSFDVAAVSSNVNIRDDGYYPAISFYQLATTTPVNVVNLTGYNGLLIDGLTNTSVTFRTTGVNYAFITAHPNLNNWLARPLSISTTNLLNNNDGAFNIGNKAQLALQTLNRYFRGVMIRGSSPQDANLLEIQNSSSGVISYIDPSGNQSGVSASYPSGITLSSGIPAATTNKLYASGTTLYWNGSQFTGAVGSTGATGPAGGDGNSITQVTISDSSVSYTLTIDYTQNAQDNFIISKPEGIEGATGPIGATGANLSLTGGSGNHLAFWTSSSGLAYDPSLKYSSGTKALTFTGTGVAASGINLNILSDSTLSFESTAGQLFSISDGLASGTIFSVNDISGMSSLEIDASGLVKIGEYDGFVGIGTSQIYSQYTGKVEVNYPSGAYKGLIVRPATGGTGNIIEAQSSTSGTLVVIDASGEIGINNPTPVAMLDIINRGSAIKGLVIKSAASQAASLFELQNSAGTSIFSISPSGSISGAISPTLLTSTGNLTLTDIHHGYIIEQTGVVGSGTFTLGTITIPTWNCMLVNIGSGVIVASGSNTMRSPGGLNKSRTQYSSISIYRRGDGSFILGGDLA